MAKNLKIDFQSKTTLECSTYPKGYCLKLFWRNSFWFQSYACSKRAVADCSFGKAGLDDPSVQYHCCQDDEEHWRNGQMTKQEQDNSVWPQAHLFVKISRTFEGQDIAWEVFALCDQDRRRAEQHAVEHLPPNKVFWDLCGHDVRCYQFSALQKWAD